MIKIKKSRDGDIFISSSEARKLADQLIYSADEADDHGIMAVTLRQSDDTNCLSTESLKCFNFIIKGEKCLKEI